MPEEQMQQMSEQPQDQGDPGQGAVQKLIAGVHEDLSRIQDLLERAGVSPDAVAMFAQVKQGYQQAVLQLQKSLEGGQQQPEQPAPEQQKPQGPVPADQGKVPISGGRGAVPVPPR